MPLVAMIALWCSNAIFATPTWCVAMQLKVGKNCCPKKNLFVHSVLLMCVQVGAWRERVCGCVLWSAVIQVEVLWKCNLGKGHSPSFPLKRDFVFKSVGVIIFLKT